MRRSPSGLAETWVLAAGGSRSAASRRARETPSQLFLSIRTVNIHLNHVYTKLGFNDRAHLATALDLPQ